MSRSSITPILDPEDATACGTRLCPYGATSSVSCDDPSRALRLTARGDRAVPPLAAITGRASKDQPLVAAPLICGRRSTPLRADPCAAKDFRQFLNTMQHGAAFPQLRDDDCLSTADRNQAQTPATIRAIPGGIVASRQMMEPGTAGATENRPTGVSLSGGVMQMVGDLRPEHCLCTGPVVGGR